MWGGVIGSLPGLEALFESSVSRPGSPLTPELWLCVLLFFETLFAGVNRPVGSEGEKLKSREEFGDVRLRDLLRIDLFSCELSEPPRFRSTTSAALGLIDRGLVTPEGGGASLRNEMRTDSSISLKTIFTALSSLCGGGGRV